MSALDRPRYGRLNKEYGMQLAFCKPEDDGPVWMVNLMKYREKADYADGRQSNISGLEADDLYAPLGPLRKLGAYPVFHAEVETQLTGDAPIWDRIGIVKYPKSASIIEMQSMPDFEELHAHKEAGMQQTFVIGSHPMPTPELPADAPSLDAVPFPSTPTDGAIIVMHTLKFADGVDHTTLDSYHDAEGEAAVAHGARITGWFKVEGTIMGDGRNWDQIRFHEYPSRAAFMAATNDAQVIKDQQQRESVVDSYSMILRPSINKLAKSTQP